MITRLYGVSTGNGNNGVSHMFADYYVKTDDPWRLAQLAMVSQFKPEWQQQALDEMDVDGETDYTIQACLYNPLDREDDENENEDGEDYCSANGAWMLVDVFPEDDPRDGPPRYDSIEECFTQTDLALIPQECAV